MNYFKPFIVCVFLVVNWCICDVVASENYDSYIRLVDGNSNYEGTVEVFHKNRWGAVCDDVWSTNAAKVVCSMLGHKRGDFVAVTDNGFNTTQINEYWLDNVNCTGNETNLFDCPHNPWGSEDCGPSELAGVRCKPEMYDRYIRLVDGNSSYEGSVEVFYNNRWGAVCDDGWSTNAAQVVCSMLGHKRDGAVAVLINGFKTIQTNEYWLDNVFCSGNETNLFDCSHRPWGLENCDDTELAGVRCKPG